MEIEPCFNLAMRKSARLITHLYEAKLAKVDLKVGQFSILRAVYFLKETTNKKLQGVLILDQTTLSRNLKPLLRDGYITVSNDPNDQRSKLIKLSTHGKSLYKRALPLWLEAQDEVRRRLGSKTSDSLYNLSLDLEKAFTT